MYSYSIPGPVGAVYWGPCHEAVAEAVKEAETFETFSYNFDHGLPVLREELRKKIRDKNGLDGVSECIWGWPSSTLDLVLCTIRRSRSAPMCAIVHHCPFLARLYQAQDRGILSNDLDILTSIEKNLTQLHI